MGKKLLFTVLCIACCCGLGAQTIKNGAFENWTIDAYNEPGGWVNNNTQIYQTIHEFGLGKTTGYSGSAIRLETKIKGKDTLLSYFTNTAGNPGLGEGGVPYSQQPIELTGFYRYDIKPGDSAVVMVLFKKDGILLTFDVFYITGSQANFTAFSFPLNLVSQPDSVIIVAASSYPTNLGNRRNGTFIELDELSFGMGTTQPIPNGNFENWTSKSYDYADAWQSSIIGISRTTDKYKGDYAMLLQTIDFGGGLTAGAYITNGSTGNGLSGGVPYTGMADTLVFHYKYLPNGTDTAAIAAVFYKNGVLVGAAQQNIYAAASYIEYELPFSSFTNPDTMLMIVASSNTPSEPTNAGSKLYIDEMHLKSQPLNTGISAFSVLGFNAYPNPAKRFYTIVFQSVNSDKAALQVFDLSGKKVLEQQHSLTAGNNELYADVSALPPALYFYTLTSQNGEALLSSRFIKE